MRAGVLCRLDRQVAGNFEIRFTSFARETWLFCGVIALKFLDESTGSFDEVGQNVQDTPKEFLNNDFVLFVSLLSSLVLVSFFLRLHVFKSILEVVRICWKRECKL